MNIRFSRHARRRLKLYSIPKEKVIELLFNETAVTEKKVVVKFIQGWQYPIKVVFRAEENSILVITVYPLKRGSK